MDFNKQGIVYAFMIIPLMFAVTVLMQGLDKISKKDPEGKVAVGFGIFFFILIGTAYFLFIK